MSCKCRRDTDANESGSLRTVPAEGRDAGAESNRRQAVKTGHSRAHTATEDIPDGRPDLTPLWFRELELVGAYTGGTESLNGTRRRTFELAIEMAAGAPMLGELVGASYPLDRWREAIDLALSAGRLGTFKVTFAPQES